jgi:hypothetical protein
MLATSPSVVSEATAEEELRSLENVGRSLLIQRLEGSRSRVRRTRGAMGIESILVSKALPDGNFAQKVVIDAHRYMSRKPSASSYLRRHPLFKRVVPDACA